MKTSRGAYMMMKMLMKWADSAGDFMLSTKRREELGLADKHTRRTWIYLREAGHVVELGAGSFQISDEAKLDLLKISVNNRRPDGRLRLVMFDIPERLKINRNLFRRHLSDLGFDMRQKSVWVSRLPCEDLVRLVVKYHGLGKYVELFVGGAVPIR